jgi:tyrosine-protein kinase Etk/Wzc
MILQDHFESTTLAEQLPPAGAEAMMVPSRPAPDEITLLVFAAELARRKKLIAWITAAATILGTALAFLLPVRYTATTRIMPPQQTESSASLLMSEMQEGGNALAALTGESLGLKNPNDMYIGLLKSRLIADGILHDFDLVRIYRSPDMTAAREKLAANTHIDSEKSGLISISFTDRDKRRAAEVANAYTSQLRSLTQNLGVTEASQRRQFYEQQLAKAGKALVGAESAFQQVQQSKGLISLDAQSRAMIENLTILRAQIAAKKVQVQSMRSYSTERNPDVALAEQELTALQSEESRLEQRSHVSKAGDLGLEDIPGIGREYLTAQHELVYRQTLYDLLIKQYDAARLDEGKEATIIEVVEPAIDPDRKSSPKRALIIIVSFLLGVVAALLHVLASISLERARANPEIDLQFSELKDAVFPRNRR